LSYGRKIAMVDSGKKAMHHFMVEAGNLDHVGHDLAQLEEGRIAYSLGRHTNDHMTSFYVNTPSGFFKEYDWGARIIDRQPVDRPHRRFRLEPAGRDPDYADALGTHLLRKPLL
jgi:hypothetical protein